VAPTPPVYPCHQSRQSPSSAVQTCRSKMGRKCHAQKARCTAGRYMVSSQGFLNTTTGAALDLSTYMSRSMHKSLSGSCVQGNSSSMVLEHLQKRALWRSPFWPPCTLLRLVS
jgi:hypothetical protein